jgi:hypothetical protein
MTNWYHIWRFDKDKKKIYIVHEEDIAGWDKANDTAAALRFEKNDEHYQAVLKGGWLEQLLRAEASKIQQEQQKHTREKMGPIYEHAAASLAKMEIPTFESYEDEYVWECFDYIGIPSKQWIADLKEAIKDHSQGQTELIDAEYYTGIRGPHLTFILKCGERERRLVIAPGVPPIEFWGKEETKKEQ